MKLKKANRSGAAVPWVPLPTGMRRLRALKPLRCHFGSQRSGSGGTFGLKTLGNFPVDVKGRKKDL
jgi:hypothetical protein